jgi:hypothetical protein
MKTHLEDPENNLVTKANHSGYVGYDEVIASIEFRIQKHREFIERDRQEIIRSVHYSDAVSSTLERIKEREVKIGELQELMEYSFQQ